MGDIIRDAVIRLRFEVQESKLKAPDLGNFNKHLKDANKELRQQDVLLRSAEKNAEQMGETISRVEKDAIKQLKETNGLRESGNRSLREQNDLLLRTGEGLRTATNGTFAFARGLALNSLSGEDELQGVLLTLADIQGKFDLMNGTIDVLKGGTETARNFSDALQSAGGAAELLNVRAKRVGLALTGVARFLGPHGLIVAGAGVAAGAIGLIWANMEDEADRSLLRAEDRLREFEDKARQTARQLSNDLELSDSLRKNQTLQERLTSRAGDLSGLAPSGLANLSLGVDSYTARSELEQQIGSIDNQLRNLVSNAGPGVAPSPDAIERVSRLHERRRGLAQKLEGLGGATLPPERDLLSSQLQAELKLEQQRRGLLESQKSDALTLAGNQDRLRNRGIADATREEERIRSEYERSREQLSDVLQQQREQERRRRRELYGLDPGQRAALQRGLGGIRNLNPDQLTELQRLAPLSATQAVNAERDRRVGLPPEPQDDRVGRLEEKLERLAVALEKTIEKREGLQGDDVRAEQSAKQFVDSIVEAMDEASMRIHHLKDDLQTMQLDTEGDLAAIMAATRRD